MSEPPVARAEALLAAGRGREAVALITAAGDAGDVDALMRLATWRLTGLGVARDFTVARTLIRRAVSIGHVDGALMEIALVANGCGGPADWGEALRLLDRAAQSDPIAAAQRLLLAQMAIDENGSPLAILPSKQLCGTPDARLFPALFTPQECRHIAEAAAPLLEPSIIVDPISGRQSRHPIRTSHGAVLGPTREDLVIQALQHRLAAATGTLRAQGEPLSVLHYSGGQEYRPHLDTLPRTTNQRVMTAIAYLNHGYGGGETVFPGLGLRIAGRTGDVLLFSNVTDDGSPEQLTQHAGLPVLSGTKWIATRWIRAKPYDPWSYSEGS